MLLIDSICHTPINVSCLYYLFCSEQIRLYRSDCGPSYIIKSGLCDIVHCAYIRRVFICTFRTTHTHTHIYIYICIYSVWSFNQNYYIFCCLFQPLSGGILVHRKTESRGTSPHKQWVQIYCQYLHTTDKDIHHFKDIRKSYIKQTGVTVNCV